MKFGKKSALESKKISNSETVHNKKYQEKSYQEKVNTKNAINVFIYQ